MAMGVTRRSYLTTFNAELAESAETAELNDRHEVTKTRRKHISSVRLQPDLSDIT
jgi:hypothetical protein